MSQSKLYKNIYIINHIGKRDAFLYCSETFKNKLYTQNMFNKSKMVCIKKVPSNAVLFQIRSSVQHEGIVSYSWAGPGVIMIFLSESRLGWEEGLLSEGGQAEPWLQVTDTFWMEGGQTGSTLSTMSLCSGAFHHIVRALSADGRWSLFSFCRSTFYAFALAKDPTFMDLQQAVWGFLRPQQQKKRL